MPLSYVQFPWLSVTLVKGTSVVSAVIVNQGNQPNNVTLWAATGVTGGAGLQVTAHIAGLSSRFLMMTILEYTSSVTFLADGAASHTQGNAGLLTTPSVTTTVSSDLLLGVAVNVTGGANASYTPGTGYTMRQTFFENSLGERDFGSLAISKFAKEKLPSMTPAEKKDFEEGLKEAQKAAPSIGRTSALILAAAVSTFYGDKQNAPVCWEKAVALSAASLAGNEPTDQELDAARKEGAQNGCK